MARPNLITQIIGQEKAVEQVKIIVGAARALGRCPSHCLFEGPPGTGKTTLANVVANECGGKLVKLNGANLRAPKDITSTLMALEMNDIVFVDEVHRMKKSVCEFLYTALEENYISLGPDEEDHIELPSFCFIGATTASGLLLQPLLDRIKNNVRLTLYAEDKLTQIISIRATEINCSLPESLCLDIAKRSRGTPRIAISYVDWIRDYVVSQGIDVVDDRHVNDAFDMLGVDKDGLNADDLKYLDYLKSYGQSSLSTLVAGTSISEDTLKNSIEPHLIRLGKIKITKAGRQINEYAESKAN